MNRRPCYPPIQSVGIYYGCQVISRRGHVCDGGGTGGQSSGGIREQFQQSNHSDPRSGHVAVVTTIQGPSPGCSYNPRLRVSAWCSTSEVQCPLLTRLLTRSGAELQHQIPPRPSASLGAPFPLPGPSPLTLQPDTECATAGIAHFVVTVHTQWVAGDGCLLSGSG